MQWMQTICNIIIIIGSVVVAIKNIAEWCGKPITFLKNQQDKVLDEKVRQIVNRLMPELMEKYGKIMQDQCYEAIVASMQVRLQKIDILSTQYEVLAIGTKDVIREKIMGIYYKHREDRTLYESEREALDQYYKDYKALGGNSYIDKRYNRMRTWEVIPEPGFDD